MPRHASTWPYHEVDRADYEGCAVQVRTSDQHARQYAADTIRLADQAPPTTKPRAPRPEPAPGQCAAEAARYRDIAARRRELATQQDALGHATAAAAFRADADHFDRLANAHEARTQETRA